MLATCGSEARVARPGSVAYGNDSAHFTRRRWEPFAEHWLVTIGRGPTSDRRTDIDESGDESVTQPARLRTAVDVEQLEKLGLQVTIEPAA